MRSQEHTSWFECRCWRAHLGAGSAAKIAVMCILCVHNKSGNFLNSS
jgi:hypothetical protein